MMSNIRTVKLLGIGVLTPALTGHPSVGIARTVEVTPVVSYAAEPSIDSTLSAAQGMLRSEVLSLTPAEKLRIAGDRIRLSAQLNQSTNTQLTKGNITKSNITKGNATALCNRNQSGQINQFTTPQSRPGGVTLGCQTGTASGGTGRALTK
jgi:hypothetical protein